MATDDNNPISDAEFRTIESQALLAASPGSRLITTIISTALAGAFYYLLIILGVMSIDIVVEYLPSYFTEIRLLIVLSLFLSIMVFNTAKRLSDIHYNMEKGQFLTVNDIKPQ